MRIGVKFTDSGDMEFVDQGYLKVTFDNNVPTSYTLSENGDNRQIDEIRVNQNVMELELDDQLGTNPNTPTFFNIDFGYETKAYNLTVSSLEYCIGASPTAGYESHDEFSDASQCQEVALNIEKSNSCGSCASVTGTLTGDFDYDSYLEVSPFSRSKTTFLGRIQWICQLQRNNNK